MGADGAGLGGLEPLLDVAAVQAEPATFRVGDEELPGLQEPGELGKAVAVGFLDLEICSKEEATWGKPSCRAVWAKLG